LTQGFAAETPGAAGTPRPVVLLLLFLIAASLALNVWYASQGLNSGRYWDERFSLENIAGILETGSLRPSNGYYQALSYLPQTAVLAASEALHRATGLEALAVFDREGRFSPTAYLLCRLLQTLYGAGSLLLTFAVGRRLFSPAVGLLGALFLAATPWHVQASSIYKPDVLLMLTVLLALWWSLRALERPGWGRWLLAGCGVALAASTKLNGVLACVPLLVGVLGSEGTWRRRARALLAAAGGGLALFALLNPFFLLYPAYFGRNLDHYTARAEAYGGTRLAVLWREAGLLADGAVHGPVVGALALAAGAAFTLRLLRRAPGERRARVEGWMLLSFPLAYSLAYAAVTPHFKGNNFVPVFPFSALLAAWGLAGLGRRAAGRWPRLRRPGAWAPAAALLAAALAVSPFLYVYRRLVPTTEELARSFLDRRFRLLAPTTARLVYSEAPAEAAGESLVAAPLRAAPFALVPVARLPALSPRRLAAADGEVFPASHLDRAGGEPYLRRLAAAPAEAVGRFAPAVFAARGPARIAIAHPWTLAAPERRFEVRPSDLERGEWQLEVPALLEPGETLSVLVSGRGLREAPRLDVAAQPVGLHLLGRSGRRAQWLSERVDPGAGAVEIRLAPAPGGASERALEVEVLRWRAPAERGAGRRPPAAPPAGATPAASAAPRGR